MTVLDPRLHAARPDLADIRLRGRVEASRFDEGRPARVCVPVADLLRAPSADASLDTQLLLGDALRVFETRDGFAWVQGSRDGYVGYLDAAALSDTAEEHTHAVAVPRTFAYRGPDMKLPRSHALPLGAQVRIVDHAETRGTRYAMLSTGEAVVARHLQPAGAKAEDYVAVAETLLRTPYLWGGASAFGIDCAGLVQLSLRMAGRDAPRDSDMQAAGLGEQIEAGEGHRNLRRGDLVFWRGHVAIMVDGATIVHANGHTMDVALEGLDEAVARIGYLYGPPTGFRRP